MCKFCSHVLSVNVVQFIMLTVSVALTWWWWWYCMQSVVYLLVFEHSVILIWPPHSKTELPLTFLLMISLKWYVAWWLFVQVVNGASKNLQKGDMFLMVCDYRNTGTAKVCSEWQQMCCVAVVRSAVSCCCVVARPGSWQPDLPAVEHWRADHIDKGEPNRPAESRKGERLTADRSCWSVW